MALLGAYDERQILEEHARRAGCKLLLSPWFNWNPASSQRIIERINVLIDGLLKIDSAPVVGAKLVAIIEPSPLPTEVPSAPATPLGTRSGPKARNLLIIGDWFAAESAVRLPGIGYQQTIATWHALTVWSRIEEFDARFDRLKLYHCSPIEAAKKLERICNEMHRYAV